MKKIHTIDSILDHLLLVLTVLSLGIKRTYKILSLPCWGIQHSRENKKDLNIYKAISYILHKTMHKINLTWRHQEAFKESS